MEFVDGGGLYVLRSFSFVIEEGCWWKCFFKTTEAMWIRIDIKRYPRRDKDRWQTFLFFSEISLNPFSGSLK